MHLPYRNTGTGSGLPTAKKVDYRRDELTIFKHTDAEVPGGPDPAPLRRFVQFQCVVGSTAYGLPD